METNWIENHEQDLKIWKFQYFKFIQIKIKETKYCKRPGFYFWWKLYKIKNNTSNL